MNVILLIIDALRMDHLGFNGYERVTSPTIDEFAREGTFFSNSYCTLSRSEATITSMITGLYPYKHGIRLVWGNKMDSSITTLQEILQSHGYKTAFLKAGPARNDGTEKGWNHFDVLTWKIINKIKRDTYKLLHPNNFLGVAQEKFSNAIKWIKKNKHNKFFLMLHTNDLHWPYDVPKPYEHMFDPDYNGEHDFATLCKGTIKRGELALGIKKLPQTEIDHAIAHYDGGIRYIDYHINRFFNFLKKENLFDNSLIIITSDHGESFGDHESYFQHGSNIYESSAKNTLIFRYSKRIPKNKIVDARVQSLDIMPTILDLLDIPILDEIEGVSLLPLIQGKTTKLARDFMFIESAEKHFEGNERMFMEGIKGKWRAMIVDDWKVIYIPHPEKDIFELYNLKDNPEELNNLIDIEKEKAEEMKKRIQEYMKPQSMEGVPKREDLTEKSRKLLIKAGYIDE